MAQSTLDPWPPHLPPAPERPKLGLVQAPNLGHATNQPLKHTRAPPQPESCKKTTRIPELVIFKKINSTPRKAPGWIQADPSGSKLLRRGSKLRIQAGPPRTRGGSAHQFAVPRGVQKSAWIRYRLPTHWHVLLVNFNLFCRKLETAPTTTHAFAPKATPPWPCRSPPTILSMT